MTDDPMHPAQVSQHLSQAARCGARTRSGGPCRSPAVTGRRRCRMHGGAQGSGGPKGARNGNYKHGRYTAQTMATRQWMRGENSQTNGVDQHPSRPTVRTHAAAVACWGELPSCSGSPPEPGE